MKEITKINYESAIRVFRSNISNYQEYFDSLNYANQKKLLAALAFKSKTEHQLLDYINVLKSKLKKQIYNKTAHVFSNEDIQKVRDYIETIDIQEKMIILTLIESGCRKSEINEIWKAFEHTSTCIINSKGDKLAKVYISDTLKEHLEIWINHPRFELVAGSKIHRTIKKVLSACKLTGAAHDFRRWLATKLRKQYAPLEQIQYVLRHNDINTTMKYVKYTDEEMLELINKKDVNINEYINESNYRQVALDLIIKNIALSEENERLMKELEKAKNEQKK